MRTRSWIGMFAAAVAGVCCAILCDVHAAPEGAPAEEMEPVGQQTIMVTSSIDGGEQPCGWIPAQGEAPQPLLVVLHPWSHGYNTFDMSDWTREAVRRNWNCLTPHFRGPNNNPDACASLKARQDILDAVDRCLRTYSVDAARIYVAGSSGGGHMTLVMAAHAPDRWAAASAWCPISDLVAWYRESRVAGGTRAKYAQDIEQSAGGPPGASESVDKELWYRSPVNHMAAAKGLPVEISTGIHDGHEFDEVAALKGLSADAEKAFPGRFAGSVPIHHTLDAFNVLAETHGVAPVSAEEIAALSALRPLDEPEEQDATYGRTVYLRRYAGPSRVTLFDGGHEGIPGAACEWLARHAKELAAE